MIFFHKIKIYCQSINNYFLEAYKFFNLIKLLKAHQKVQNKEGDLIVQK